MELVKLDQYNYAIYNKHSNLVALYTNGIVRYKDSNKTKYNLNKVFLENSLLVIEWIKTDIKELALNPIIQGLTGNKNISLEKQTCDQYNIDIEKLGLRVTDQIINAIKVTSELKDQAKLDLERVEQRKKESHAHKMMISRIQRKQNAMYNQ